MPPTPKPFDQPDVHMFDYAGLLRAMKECRERTQQLIRACGLRNAARREAEALIEQIDAVACLTRVPDAEHLVGAKPQHHATPPMK